LILKGIIFMNELSLFSGSGGGLLATKHFLNWRTIGYVEFNNYCQQVLAQRVKDGALDEAPIFTDIRAFIDEGYADAYKGMVGVISAGFPCQPFSVAGKKKAKDDARNMWPQTLDVIRRVRPRYCLLENVPGLLSRKHRYFETILKDLAEGGYNAKWKVISAAEVGAPHKRDRLFIMAYSDSGYRGENKEVQAGGNVIKHGGEYVADTEHLRQPSPEVTGSITQRSNSNQARKEATSKLEGCGKQHAELADTEGKRYRGRDSKECRDEGRNLQQSEQGWGQMGREAEGCGESYRKWWSTEPNVGRVAHGVASRVDRLKALGNGQVPRVVETAWEILTEGYNLTNYEKKPIL
jgi:DNA (cytosine-5)-methyltransferase 1